MNNMVVCDFVGVLPADPSLSATLPRTSGKVLEVVWADDFALQNREVDLDLVQPAGVHGRVHHDGVGKLLFEMIDCGLSSVR